MTTRQTRTKRYARRARVRSLLDAVSDWFARVVDGGEQESTALNILPLEDRVLFNAAPMGDVMPDVADVVSEQVDDVINLIDAAVESSSFDLVANSELSDVEWQEVESEEVGSRDHSVDDETDSDAASYAETAEDVSSRSEIIFVDSGVENYEDLVKGIQRDGTGATEYEVVVLRESESGIARITAALGDRKGIDAIHIVSHGNDAGLTLGSDWLTSENVDGFAWQIDEWKFALDEGADLLIYGCDLASGESGQRLLESLSASCDCDVAASVDDTGHAMFGGDWDLEFSTGDIETDVAISDYMQAQWGHLLDVTIDATSLHTTASGASSDSVMHTTSGSDRLMLVGISFGEDKGNSVDSVTYNATPLTLVGTRDNADGAASRVEIWSLVAPATGTANVNVTYSGTDHEGATIGVMTFNGVDQATALGSFASDEGDSGNLSTTVASATGEMVFGVAALTDSNDWDFAPGLGQTEYWDLFRDKANGAGSTEAGASSVVTSWTVATTSKWVAAGVSVKPTAASTIVVDTTNDVNDGDTSSISALIANKGPDGSISLREAIVATNNDAGIQDQITLPSGSYLLSGGELEISDDLVLIGADARTTIVDGQGADRVFNVTGNAVTMSGLTIQGGDSSNGGGVLVDGSTTLNLSDAILTGNTNGSNAGGAIHVHGTLNLERVLLFGNTAKDGGAIGFHGANGGSLTNVTISGNAASSEGGGIYTDTPITVTNSTIAFNTAAAGGGVFDKDGGEISITNSILHNPMSTNSNLALNSNGFNIDSDGTAGLGEKGDLTGVDPLLQALANYGGTTDTHALSSGSIAINAGANDGAPTVDQRSLWRDVIPDIGAYEATVTTSKLYWTDLGENAILRGNTDGSGIQTVVSGVFNGAGIAVDLVGGKLYWSDDNTDKIQQSDLDGNNLVDVLTGVSDPRYIELGSDGKIYFANDSGLGGKIERVNVDGTNRETVYNSLVLFDPVGVSVDVVGGKAYWTDAALGGTVSRANLNGTNLELTGGQPSSEDIELDLVSAQKKVYWVSDGDNVVRRSNLDFSSIETVATGINDGRGLALDTTAEKLYVIDGTVIKQSNLDGTGIPATVVSGLNAPNALALVTVQSSNILEVDTTADILDGNTSSISALLGDRGTDGAISLREAIIATNNTTNPNLKRI